jgi:hypothetical protein
LIGTVLTHLAPCLIECLVSSCSVDDTVTPTCAVFEPRRRLVKVTVENYPQETDGREHVMNLRVYAGVLKVRVPELVPELVPEFVPELVPELVP